MLSVLKDSSTQYRRAVLMEGACGQARRLQCCGQLLDFPIPPQDLDLEEKWDPFLSLPLSAQERIRPLEDLMIASVQGAILKLEVLDIQPKDFDESKAQSYKALFCSPEFRTDANGFFSCPLDADLQSSFYVLRITLVKIASLRQSLKDLQYLRKRNKQTLQSNICVGYGKLHVLEADFQGHVLISDLDQSLVRTPIGEYLSLAATLLDRPKDKQFINGMPALYRELSRCETGAKAFFLLSASPHCFYRTMFSFFAQSNMRFDAVYLKYIDLIGFFSKIGGKLWELSSGFPKYLKGDLRSFLEAMAKYVSTHVYSFIDNVGYKLEMLLQNRLMQPTGAREILVGDNTDSDFFVFTLYQFFVQKILSAKELRAYLRDMRFLGREVITPETAAKVFRLSQENSRLHGSVNPVSAVWINHAAKGADKDKKAAGQNAASARPFDQKYMDELICFALPPSLRELYEKSDLVCRPLLCGQGWEMALAAFDAKLIDITALKNIATEAKSDPESPEKLLSVLQKE